MTSYTAQRSPATGQDRSPGGGPRRSWPVIAVWAIASTIAAAGLLAAQSATGLSMDVLSLVMLAPAAGAGICWLTARGHLPTFPGRAPAGGFLRAIALSITAVVIYFAAVSVFRGHPPQVPGRVDGVPVAIVILAQALGALAEEIGFRGILFHALAVKLPRLVSATVVGLLFGVWHVQYFGLPLIEHLTFLLGSVALTLTMAFVMTGSFWQRMIVCTILHLGVNLALAFTDGDTVPMTGFGLALVFGCLVVTPIAVASARGGKPTGSA